MDAVTRQRSTLCDLLESLSDAQWEADTMCEGWDAGDIAAHLLVREREPWAAAGIFLPPLSGLAERRTAARREKGRDALIAALREGPPTALRLGFLGRVQVGEDWIHAEDIRRGGAAAIPGAPLDPDDGTADAEIDQLLWQAIGRFAPLTMSGLDREGVIAMTDSVRTRAYAVGGRLVRPAEDGRADVTINGSAGELLLYVTGRRGHQAHLHGDQALIEAMEAKARQV